MNGFNYTQATLSRDLKFLKAGKLPMMKRGIYISLPGGNEDQNMTTN
jgi:arginine repressor